MTKQSSKDKLLAFAKGQGWVLDTTETIDTYTGWGRLRLSAEDQARYIKQHPYKFTRPAVDGGRWQIEFDYRNKGSYGSRFGDRLHGAYIRYFDAQGTEAKTGFLVAADIWHLQRPTTYRWRSFTFDVTGHWDTPITKRVETLLTDPELVLWLAAEAKFIADEERKAAIRADRIDREERERPLPQGWSTLAAAAREITRADGKSDPVALIAALREGIAAVEDNWAAQII